MSRRRRDVLGSTRFNDYQDSLLYCVNLLVSFCYKHLKFDHQILQVCIQRSNEENITDSSSFWEIFSFIWPADKKGWRLSETKHWHSEWKEKSSWSREEEELLRQGVMLNPAGWKQAVRTPGNIFVLMVQEVWAMFPVNQQYLACFLLNSDTYKCLSSI